MFRFIGKCFWSLAGICFFISVGIVVAGMNESEMLGPAVKFIQAAGEAVMAWAGALWDRWAASNQELLQIASPRRFQLMA